MRRCQRQPESGNLSCQCHRSKLGLTIVDGALASRFPFPGKSILSGLVWSCFVYFCSPSNPLAGRLPNTNAVPFHSRPSRALSIHGSPSRRSPNRTRSVVETPHEPKLTSFEFQNVSPSNPIPFPTSAPAWKTPEILPMAAQLGSIQSSPVRDAGWWFQ